MNRTELPIAGGDADLLGTDTSERGDAARNRRLLLDAAALLVAERSVDCISMEAVAARAGVGKGTVFRRFGSRAGLMHALLDHSEKELQSAFMFGPPPLGPGAEPIDRLVAFGRARLDLIELQGEILRAAEAGIDMRYTAAPRLVSVSHIVMMLRQNGTPGDLRLLADALLAALDASLVLHQIHDQHMPIDRIADNWEVLARRVAGGVT
ncbi:TetR/AcrR family transcriptional regulator [Antrihabitans cavernicola]|uniref:TetR/AcrR family transcriptional regulator n=1 Tax=Antrihabitans cavernicola TaxID=2495913 RepID=UPI0035302423